MASRTYCNNVAGELETWSERLHNLSSEIDAMPTGSKERLFSQIEGLHQIMTELDERLCAMMEECRLVEPISEVDKPFGVKSFGKTTVGAAEKFDYEIGG
jgi:hypothetical protein